MDEYLFLFDAKITEQSDCYKDINFKDVSVFLIAASYLIMLTLVVFQKCLSKGNA